MFVFAARREKLFATGAWWCINPATCAPHQIFLVSAIRPPKPFPLLQRPAIHAIGFIFRVVLLQCDSVLVTVVATSSSSPGYKPCQPHRSALYAHPVAPKTNFFPTLYTHPELAQPEKQTPVALETNFSPKRTFLHTHTDTPPTVAKT